MKARRNQLWSVAALSMVLAVTVGTGMALAGQEAAQTPSESGVDESKRERCRELMNQREAMLEEIAAMDVRLDKLRAELNLGGEGKPTRALPPGAGAWPSNEWEWTRNIGDVLADVKTLVDHSKTMHRVMEAMNPQMIGHIMEDMGASEDGTKPPMVDCPMMKEMPPASEQGGHGEPSSHDPDS